MDLLATKSARVPCISVRSAESSTHTADKYAVGGLGAGHIVWIICSSLLISSHPQRPCYYAFKEAMHALQIVPY